MSVIPLPEMQVAAITLDVCITLCTAFVVYQQINLTMGGVLMATQGGGGGGERGQGVGKGCGERGRD